MKQKKCKPNTILQVDTKTYNQIRRKSVLYIDWRTCYYTDYVHLIQCYKCWKFGHLAKNCKNGNDICPKCAGEHKLEDCNTEQVVCVNWKHASQTLKIPNINFNHAAYNKDCEAYKRVFNQLQQKVNYFDINERKNI